MVLFVLSCAVVCAVLCLLCCGVHRLKVMGGLVGGLVIDAAAWENVPTSLLSMDSFVLVITG